MFLLQRKYRPLLGLDITTSSVKLIELAMAGGQYRVEAYAAEPTPQNAINEKAIVDAEAVGEAIRRAVKRAGHASLPSDATTDLIPRSSWPSLPLPRVLPLHSGHLDKARSDSFFRNAPGAARDAFGSPGARRRSAPTSMRFRETPHVQFDSALIYSAPGFKTGRSFSGVMA